jgi:hypothetical protein
MRRVAEMREPSKEAVEVHQGGLRIRFTFHGSGDLRDCRVRPQEG